MKLILTRKKFASYGVFGELTDDLGNFIAVTCEHAYLDHDGKYMAKLYPGNFVCVRGEHRLEHMEHPFTTFEIEGVGGHSDILFHVGNYAQTDSSGCVLLGMGLGTTIKDGASSMIVNSKVAFEKFMKQTEGLSSFHLTVV